MRFEDLFKQPFIFEVKNLGTTWAKFQTVVGDTYGKDAINAFNKRMIAENPKFNVKSVTFDVYPNSEIHYENAVSFVLATVSVVKPLLDEKTVYTADIVLTFRVRDHAPIRYKFIDPGFRVLESEAVTNIILDWIQENVDNANSKFVKFVDSLVDVYRSGIRF